MASAMEYRRLGSTGLKVSALSFGSWVTFHNQLDTSQVKELLETCRNAGVNYFDNAEVYAGGKAEYLMGRAIKELGWKRSDLVISTKIFWGGQGPNDQGLSRKHIIEGTKASLQRLDMEYLDLIFCHRPDPDTGIEETVRAMNWVIDKGWAYYWGTSEWSADQIQEAWDVSEKLGLAGPAMEQAEYNMFERKKVESDYAHLYKKHGLGLTIWSPLASGVLTGKYSSGIPEGSRFSMSQYKNIADKGLQQVAIVDMLRPIAKDLGCTLAQLAIAWCAKNPNVSTVITGATKKSQVEDNMGALKVMAQLNDNIMAKIENILQSIKN